MGLVQILRLQCLWDHKSGALVQEFVPHGVDLRLLLYHAAVLAIACKFAGSEVVDEVFECGILLLLSSHIADDYVDVVGGSFDNVLLGEVPFRVVDLRAAAKGISNDQLRPGYVAYLWHVLLYAQGP